MASRRAGVIPSGLAVVDRSHSLPRFSPGRCHHEPPAAAVLVIFADHAACPWLRPLRRGFRHCFVVMRAGSVWLACEPLKDRIELDALAVPDDFDLAAFYCQQGHQVLLGERLPARARSRFALAPPDLRDRGETAARDRRSLGMDSLAAVRAPVRPEGRLPGPAGADSGVDAAAPRGKLHP
jgi:hypothetical protein